MDNLEIYSLQLASEVDSGLSGLSPEPVVSNAISM